jgi:hypothetical protein
MATTLQFRRGTTSQLATQTGAVAELFVDTTKDTVVVMDGSTQGGFPLAKESDLSEKQDTLVSGINIKTINNQSILGSGNITIEGDSTTPAEPTTFTSQRGYDASGTYGDMGTSFSSDTPDVWSASSFGWIDQNNYNTLVAFTSGTSFTMNFRGTTFNGTLTSNFIDGDFGKTATVSWTGSAPTVSYYDSPNSFTIGGVTYSNTAPYQTSFDYLSGAVSASDSELVVAGPDAWSDPAEFNSTIALTTGAEISVVYQGNTYTGTLSSNFAELDPEFDPGRYTASITWQSSSGLETFPLSVESITVPPGVENTSLEDVTLTGTTTLQQSTEILNTKSSASGTVTHDFSTGSIWYHNNISANFTANFTNIPTTNNRTIVVTLILGQGGTAYIPNAVQINSSSVTINWLGGEQPSGTTSGYDIVSFTLIRVSSTWVVLGSLTSYEAI